MTAASRAAIAGVLAAACAAAGCNRALAKVVMGAGGAVTVGAVASGQLRDCAAEDSCEVPRAEPFVGLAGVGILLVGFAMFMLSDPPPPEAKPAPAPPIALAPPPPPLPPDPVDLTERARYAARAGQCDAVARLSARVAALDREHHERSFVTDAAIARCLAQPGQPGGQ
jgi:hypothetical protein